MSASPEDNQTESQSSETPRRSRWRRFSPSMGWKAFRSEILIVVRDVVVHTSLKAMTQEKP